MTSYLAALAVVAALLASACVSHEPPTSVEIRQLGPALEGRRVKVTGEVADLRSRFNGRGTLGFTLYRAGSSVACHEDGWNVVILADLASRLEGATKEGGPVTIQGVYLTAPRDDGRVEALLEIETVEINGTEIDADYKDFYRYPAWGWVYSNDDD